MAWKSDISAKSVVITDRNYHQWAPKQPRQLVKGEFGRGFTPRDYEREPLGTYADTTDRFLVDPGEVYERAQEKERKKRRLSDFARAKKLKVLAQGSTNYCWINGPTFGCMLRNIIQGQSHILLSPASGGSKIKGFRNQGGWGDQACEWIASHGLMPQTLWPPNAISRQYDTDAGWTEADKHVLTDWNEGPPRDLLWLYSCLLNDIPVPVGYSWWRHLVCAVDVVVIRKPKSRTPTQRELQSCFAIRIANSWGEQWGDDGYGLLKDGRQVPDGQCSINQMRLRTRTRRSRRSTATAA